MDLHCDFYFVEPTNGKTVGMALKAIGKNAEQDRSGIVQHRNYRISHLSYNSSLGLWTGDIVQVRMKNLPVIASVDSDTTKDIELEDNQGIGECSAFCFSDQDNILILQRNRLSIGQSLFGPLMRELSGIDVPWELKPIPRNDALERLQGAQEVQRVTVDFARVKPTEISLGGTTGTAQAIKMISEGIVPKMRIEISTGRSADKLSPRSAIAFVNRVSKFVGLDSDIKVDEIGVKGRDADGELFDILVCDFVLSHKGVVSDTQSRRASYAIRKKVVLEGFSACIVDAREMLQESINGTVS